MRTAVRGAAAVLLVIGALVLGWTGYEAVGTGSQAAAAQVEATRRLDTGAVPSGAPAVGDPVARMTIPRLGADWGYTVLEGTDHAVLADGPGHYVGTALPGRPGNVGIAGHRVGRGSPFDELDALRPCDDIVLRTRSATFTYRVLPSAPGGCTAGRDLDAAYDDVPGVEIVTPDRSDVLATVPGRADARPDRAASLLTLTTCHPRWSARQRLVVHAVLVDAAGTGLEAPGGLRQGAVDPPALGDRASGLADAR